MSIISALPQTVPTIRHYVKDMFFDIRARSLAIKDRLQRDHQFDSSVDTTDATCDGYHKIINLPVVTTDPEVPAGGGVAYCKTISGLAELCYANDDGRWCLTRNGRTTMGETLTYLANCGNYVACACSNSDGSMLVVGRSSYISYSNNDGASWTDVSISNIRSIAYSQDYNRFVAVGTSGIFSSEDGVSWTLRYSSTSPAAYFYKVAYGGGYFVAVGRYDGDAIVFYSSDGIAWTQVLRETLGDGLMYDVTYDNASGNFYFCGYTYISSVGTRYGICSRFYAPTGTIYYRMIENESFIKIAAYNNVIVIISNQPDGGYCRISTDALASISGVCNVDSLGHATYLTGGNVSIIFYNATYSCFYVGLTSYHSGTGIFKINATNGWGLLASVSNPSIFDFDEVNIVNLIGTGSGAHYLFNTATAFDSYSNAETAAAFIFAYKYESYIIFIATNGDVYKGTYGEL